MGIVQMAKKTLKGHVDNQTAIPEDVTVETPEVPEKAEVPGLEWKEDTFTITVKVDPEEVTEDEWKSLPKMDGCKFPVLYENKKETFKYPVVDSLITALEYEGAVLTEDAKEFFLSALKSDDAEVDDKIAKAHKAVMDTYNSTLKQNASRNQYQKLLKKWTPITEEGVTNANASIVRNFMRANGVSDDVALGTLQKYQIVPADFTIEKFRSNKGKR